MRLYFIINPIAGCSSKHKTVDKITSQIDKSKYDVTIRYTSYAGHATELATEAVNAGVDIVVAVGGDGTVNEVARSLINTETALGIIPCGSGNGLARHLRISRNILKAVKILNNGNVDTIDIMTVNGIPCFCTMGVGYDAFVTAEYSKDSRRGLITYIKKSVGCWRKYEPQEYVVETSKRIIKRHAFSITCANANQWGNGFHVAPKASLKDGLIDITIIRPIRFWETLVMLFQILGYSFDRNSNVEYIKTNKLSIQSNGYAIPAHIDGEAVLFKDYIDISSCRSALKVIVSYNEKPI